MAACIEIELEAHISQPTARGTTKLKLYNIPSLAEKLKLWLIVLLSVCLGLFTLTNSTIPCISWRPSMP